MEHVNEGHKMKSLSMSKTRQLQGIVMFDPSSKLEEHLRLPAIMTNGILLYTAGHKSQVVTCVTPNHDRTALCKQLRQVKHWMSIYQQQQQ